MTELTAFLVFWLLPTVVCVVGAVVVIRWWVR